MKDSTPRERGFNIIILTPTRGVSPSPQPQQPNMRSLPQPQKPNRRSLPQPQQPNKWSLPQPHQETQLSPTGTPCSLSFSTCSLDSPFPHFLDLTDRMNDMVNVGIQLTPRPNPIFSPLNPPPRPVLPIPPRWKTPSPKRHRAPPPPLTQIICESD